MPRAVVPASVAPYYPIVSVVVLLTFLLTRAITSPRSSGDTAVLVSDAGRIVECIRDNVLHGCTIVHFPLFQFVPATLLRLGNVSDTATFSFFAWLNWAAFAATTILLWSSLYSRASPAVALAAVFVLLTSPLLPYTVETFNEPVAAFLTLAFSVAIVSRKYRPWIVAVFCIAVAVTKETAPPFLLLIGALPLLVVSDSVRSRSQHIVPVVLGVVIGAAINGAFNYFRYDSLMNVQILAREFRVDTSAQMASNLAGIWLSPNAGVVPFWPSCTLILAVVVFAGLRPRPPWNVSPWPARVSIFMLVALSVGFASWYAPHGWIAWGPRLLLPWLPATVFLACYFYRGAIEHGLALLTASTFRMVLSVGLLVVCALPHFIETLDSRVLGMFFLAGDEVFDHAIAIQENRKEYFAYVNYLMWSKRSMLLQSYDFALHPLFRDKILLYIACLTTLAYSIRLEVKK